MTNQLKNSKFLQFIFDYAENIKKKNNRKITSANIIFFAMIYLCSDESFEKKFKSSDNDMAEIEEFKLKISSLSLPAKINVEKLHSTLFVKESFMDDLAWRQYLIASEKSAKSQGKTEITAALLLESILASPTTEIKLITETKLLHEEPEQQKTGDDGKKQFSMDIEEKIIKELEKSENDPEAVKSYINEQTLKTKLMLKNLTEKVLGQDHAVSTVASGYFQAELQSIIEKDRERPKATFLFAGPPGVGKTHLAKTFAGNLHIPYERFDMSEYAERDSIIELCGTNPSYKDAKEGSLTGFVRKNPECVLLFDEIEKAHINAILLFLQILDGGKLRDTFTSKDVDFSKATIIFTTNAGRKIYEDSGTFNLSSVPRKTILKALETDIDPKTGMSAFPAAICSRFATGNVVMFNHMEAHILKAIAEKELNEKAARFEEETGIKINISDDVYSCILFAEGGHADARTVKSRAAAFFASELYELFRLISSDKKNLKIEDVAEINVSLSLPKDNGQVSGLFRSENKLNILVFTEKANSKKIQKSLKNYNIITAASSDEAKEKIEKEDISLILCDLHTTVRKPAESLNIEDIDSAGRDLFKFVCDKTDIPLYIICNEKNMHSEEEMFSLYKEGARGVLDISNENNLVEALCEISLQIHHQDSMMRLARSNKIVTYGTSQTVSADGKTAQIELFDISLATAIAAEDTNSILSNMSKPNVKFSDVIGADGAKKELEFFVNYLKNPKAFSSKGLGTPKGVLFYGPPGTGKTLLAKAMAGESDVTFITAEGDQFKSKWHGEGEERVHSLFVTARKYAPTVLFIDEIDAIARERTGGDGASQADASILTAFLAEMDGFKTDPRKPVFVLAATNYDVEPGTAKSLDSALLRRFDRLVYIDLPDKEARIRFMNMKIAKNKTFKLSENEIENIAVRSTGMSLANLENVFEFSLRIAVRSGKDSVDDDVFEEAFETFNYGEEKQWDKSELERTSRHEAGHALLCWLSGETPSYMTIVSRGNHGGYMQHDVNEKRGSYSKKMLLDRIRTSLGGRAAELVYYGAEDGLTTGASGDLQNATRLARSIVCSFGMDDDLGLACISETEAVNGEIAKEVRRAINCILTQEMQNAEQAIINNKAAIDALVEELMLKNSLSSDEIDFVFRKATEEA